MSKRSVFAILVLVGFGGWALAQQGGPAPRQVEPARYAVSSSGNTAVMVETATGKTWFLHPGMDDTTVVWLPIEKIDDPVQAQEWLAKRKDVLRVLDRKREALEK